jgi:hypothetical protein
MSCSSVIALVILRKLTGPISLEKGSKQERHRKLLTIEINRSELKRVLPSVNLDGREHVSRGMLLSPIEKGMTPRKRRYHGIEVENDNLAYVHYG